MKFQIFWILCLLSFANCSKFFSNGRLSGGNLPPPGGPLVKSAYVEELYFTQKLDHFTPTNTNTWQQVSEYIAVPQLNSIFLHDFVHCISQPAYKREGRCDFYYLSWGIIIFLKKYIPFSDISLTMNITMKVAKLFF